MKLLNNPGVAQLAEAADLKSAGVYLHAGSTPATRTNSPYKRCKIYGPYVNSRDNRKRVLIIFPSGKRKTTAYARFLLECKLKRFLEPFEEAHHKDEDESNDVSENLEVKIGTVHRQFHLTRYIVTKFACPVCNKKFTLTGKQMSNRAREMNRGKCKTGPFCSRRCSGKVNH